MTMRRHRQPHPRRARAAHASDVFLFARVCGLLLILSPLAPATVEAQGAPDPKLEKAVASLRGVVPDKLSEEQQETKAREIDEAWSVIQAAGPKGLARLKRELQQLDARKERDDFFKLNASVLLWELGKFDEAQAVGEIWSTTPLKVSYNYPFYTAMDAARTQDERALPMLRAILRDKEGSTFLVQHAMEVKYPLSHEFVWGAFGPKGLPVLARVLETSQDPTELASSMRLLARAQHVESLPRVRELATKGTGEVRLAAVAALGIFGHPQDYELLLAGLKSNDAVEVFHYTFALFEFEDLRAVPHIVPLLQSPHGIVRYEAASALRHLLTPTAFGALRASYEAAKDGPEKERLKRIFDLVLGNAKTTWEEYQRKSPQEKEAFIAERRRWLEDEPRSGGAGEKPMTRAEFLKAAAHWKAQGRLEDEARGSVDAQDILSAATVEDIPLLLDVKSRFYLRLSDECLYETARIDEAVKHLGRGRYRRTPGVTERAEAK